MGLGVTMMPSVQVPVGEGVEDVVVDDDREVVDEVVVLVADGVVDGDGEAMVRNIVLVVVVMQLQPPDEDGGVGLAGSAILSNQFLDFAMKPNQTRGNIVVRLVNGTFVNAESVDGEGGLDGTGLAFARMTAHSRASSKDEKVIFACILPNEEGLVLLENCLIEM
jgi:hypothetical protein